jgi:peptidoglycan DL-endopeptidase CwlO
MRKHHSKRHVVRQMAGTFLATSAATLCIFGSIGAPSASAAVAGGKGQAADRFALAQVGKPYAYGAAGPAAYDCSGLVYGAYHAVGVSLPRVAAQQYAAGRHVALNQLQPGDLLFWAHDPHNPATIYHVAMYTGFGAVVHAPHPGTRVSVMSVHDWYPNVALATRP